VFGCKGLVVSKAMCPYGAGAALYLYERVLIEISSPLGPNIATLLRAEAFTIFASNTAMNEGARGTFVTFAEGYVCTIRIEPRF
jgi:hypothetical protein